MKNRETGRDARHQQQNALISSEEKEIFTVLD
jgi:hypothetical protein